LGKKKDKHLSVGLCDTLELVLLLDGVRVGRFLGGVDELVGEALSNRLNVSERCGSGTRGEQEDGLVHSTEWGDIDSLSSDGTGTADTRGVFSWTRVDHGRDEDLDWVFAGQEVDDLKGVFDDSKRQELLTVVSAVHHHGVDHTFNDWARGLSESLLGVSTSSVWDDDGGAFIDCDVVDEGDVINLDVLQVPLVEELECWLVHLGSNLDFWCFGTIINPFFIFLETPVDATEVTINASNGTTSGIVHVHRVHRTSWAQGDEGRQQGGSDHSS